MADNNTFNFDLYLLRQALFSTLKFERKNILPDPMGLDLQVLGKVVTENFPQTIQVHLRIQTRENQPITIDTEIIGLFDLVEGGTPPEIDYIAEFTKERGLPMLWSQMAQMYRIISGQMGMNPLTLNVPPSFDYVSTEEIVAPAE